MGPETGVTIPLHCGDFRGQVDIICVPVGIFDYWRNLTIISPVPKICKLQKAKNAFKMEKNCSDKLYR